MEYQSKVFYFYQNYAKQIILIILMYMLILNYSNSMIQLIFMMNQLNAYIYVQIELAPNKTIYLFIYDQINE